MTTIASISQTDINNSYKTMGREEELACVIKAKSGDHVSQNKLINSQLKRIVSVARGYANHLCSIHDLISEGTLGLIKAIDGYDLERSEEIRFGSYAAWWIRETISGYVCDTQLVRVPRNHAKTTKEVRNENGVVVKERKEAVRINSVSINAPVSSDNDTTQTFESLFKDETNVDADILSEYNKIMEKLTTQLTTRELEMYQARVINDMTYEEIGEMFKINTREGVRQHINNIIAKVAIITSK